MELVRKTIAEDEKFLRQVSVPVSFEDNKYKEDISAAKDYCLKTECFALAAVQVGIPKRFIILKSTSLDDEEVTYENMQVIINPTVISRCGKTEYWEACLSCLDNTGLVTRPYKMEVEYYTENEEKKVSTFEGFEATILAHELDHLDGILHMDRAEKVLVMNVEERKAFRESHGYEIISKTCKWTEDIALVRKKIKS